MVKCEKGFKKVGDVCKRVGSSITNRKISNKSYNPFKMIFTWVLGIILGFLGYAAYSLCGWDGSCTTSGMITSVLLGFITGFLIGWIINSLFRRFLK